MPASGFSCTQPAKICQASASRVAADEHPDNPTCRHTTERADQDDGHRHVHATAKQQRLEHIVRHAGDEQERALHEARQILVCLAPQGEELIANNWPGRDCPGGAGIRRVFC
jgi:hypothetical protein